MVGLLTAVTSARLGAVVSVAVVVSSVVAVVSPADESAATASSFETSPPHRLQRGTETAGWIVEKELKDSVF